MSFVKPVFKGKVGHKEAVVYDADGVGSALVFLQKKKGPLLEEIDLSGTNGFDKILMVGLDPDTIYSYWRG